MPGGVAGTTTTKVSFPEKIETSRDNDPKDQQVLESSTDSGGSTNHDTGTAPPYWTLSRGP